MTEKLSAARIKANKKWDDENRERKRYLNSRSAARGFIKNKATADDIEELTKLLANRKQELNLK
ncbi:hypothetical protein [Companilactobacillus baiquanensis]|uniref:Phage protein n=1 Tax=Companilactobacillus baiquanensis TaxID=2486005 RepID=A0ABW1UX82_9LACO|nr:hypothetical protein [Companilactobacillus baiquanensis]